MAGLIVAYFIVAIPFVVGCAVIFSKCLFTPQPMSTEPPWNPKGRQMIDEAMSGK